MKQSKFWLLFGIISILSLFLSTVVKAADTTKVTTSVVYNDAKQLIKAGDAKIGSALSSLGKSLKVGADQVWTVLVRQQKVWSFCYLLLTLSALLNWYKFYTMYVCPKNIEYEKGVKTIFSDTKNPHYSEYITDKDSPRYGPYLREDHEILILKPNNTWYDFKYLHLIIAVLLSVFSYIHFADMLTGFMNPEYGAMKTIATIAQNLK